MLLAIFSDAYPASRGEENNNNDSITLAETNNKDCLKFALFRLMICVNVDAD